MHTDFVHLLSLYGRSIHINDISKKLLLYSLQFCELHITSTLLIHMWPNGLGVLWWWFGNLHPLLSHLPLFLLSLFMTFSSSDPVSALLAHVLVSDRFLPI